MDRSLEQLVKQLGEMLKTREWKLVTAESCTGGGLAYTLTHFSGSSFWYDGGFVTYSNDSKEKLLGVKSATLNYYGAVSEQTAREMAEGALKNSQAQVSIAITGIAGPEGGSKEKPIGTIWIACAGVNFNTQTYSTILSGTRSAIREQTIKLALERILKII